MSRSRRLFGFFLAAGVFYGGTFVAAKAGLASFPPLLFVSLRFDIGTVVLIAYAVSRFSREELVPKSRADIAAILGAGVFVIALANAFIFVGEQFTSSGVGSIIYSLNPILTPVLAGVLLTDERLSRGGAVGLALGFVGVALVVGITPASLLGGGLIGKVIMLAAAASGALGSVLIRRFDSSLSSTVRTAWALPVGALVCHLLSLAAGETPAMIDWTVGGVVALGYVGVFSGALAFIAYFGLLDEAGAIRANLVFYLSPVVATLGGWALLGESVSATTLVGFAIIFAGFVVLGREPLAAELARLRENFATESDSGRLAPTTRSDASWGDQD